ncbi:MAG: hypothetical protein P8015_11280 [Acidihalobacter sp.]
MPYHTSAIDPRITAGTFAPNTPKDSRATTAYGTPQIGEQLHDENPEQQADQHLPAGQSEREQAGGEHIAADAVHVGHPEREDVVPGPMLRTVLVSRSAFLQQGRQIAVAQALAVLRRTFVIA